MWYLNPRTISDVCSNGKFDGATEFDYDFMIPKAVGWYAEGRVKSREYKNLQKGKEK